MKKNNQTFTIIVFGIATLFFLSGCETPEEGRGAATGAVLGGITGAVVGNNVGDGENQELGAAIGALAGAAAGQKVGRKQADRRITETSQNRRIAELERSQNTRIIYVENSNGSTTPVTLVRMGTNEWKGPRGEIYSGLPTQDQLRPVYGF